MGRFTNPNEDEEDEE
ncbi:Protein CBG21156 [Caenorhabditis briggsae]|uniref:Protein CBG21156 n=1 Tax=Caenorhabditis briggsae TaxID=6238 RepID=A8XZC8_CAEBR|nr:Protein CBG21156 [Caenorhabditis briggsae]CAP38055.2 Protein CBG21156 [Caenorhabditis briggsae]